MASPHEEVHLEYYTSLVKQDLEQGLIMLMGEIEPCMSAVLVRDLRECLRLRGPGPVTVELFSGGGGVHPALHMYDTIRAYSKTHGLVTVLASGMVASAAAGIVLQAADDRAATPSCRIMLHEVAMNAPQNMTITMSSLEDMK